MNPTVHRNEAREMMAQVCVESGEIATLEHARQSANVIFSTPEEREANRLERERARQAKIAQDINDKEESLRKAEEFVNHRANRLG
ncbi:hypothetical protein [Candidatus Bodocaedibacter vickermanii]|uniref:Uncharacterized protein n=1 Tax=Candidatus Bodocaedibacter vickermanii TaxID=2741701 RepID=A0A7L9RUL1_9PROT|nr:hypothetical protein CPBP_01014 [Candidatus Paracaedibacteraceae bacterium 'Lake Konstanz']